MNVKRGIYRITQLIKWTSRVLGGLFFLSIAYVFIIRDSDSEHALVPLLVTVGCMAIAEGIAWVLEGFADD